MGGTKTGGVNGSHLVADFVRYNTKLALVYRAGDFYFMDSDKTVIPEFYGTIHRLHPDDATVIKKIFPTLQGDWTQSTAIYLRMHSHRELTRKWLNDNAGPCAMGMRLCRDSTDYERYVTNPEGSWFQSSYFYIRDPDIAVLYKLTFTVIDALPD